MQSHLGFFTLYEAIRLKWHLNLLLLHANRSEKMASHQAGHCHVSFCFFGAGYPQFQPPLVCLLQLSPEVYPMCWSPRPPTGLGCCTCVLHPPAALGAQFQRTILSRGERLCRLILCGSRGWAWTSVLLGPGPKGKTHPELGRIWIKSWTGLGGINK